MIDLRVDHLEIVKAILRKHAPEAEIRAFGSRVTGTAKDHSDLDLAIVRERAMDFRAKALLEEAFEESDLPFRVDVIDWAGVGEDFRRIIARQYVVLQKAGGKNEGVNGDGRGEPAVEVACHAKPGRV
jgi:type I restriction enzyme S subunit